MEDKFLLFLLILLLTLNDFHLSRIEFSKDPYQEKNPKHEIVTEEDDLMSIYIKDIGMR